MFYLCIRLITKHMDEITKIETVDQYDQLFGLETLHPLVNVIDFSKATKSVEYIRMNIGFYCLFLKDAKSDKNSRILSHEYRILLSVFERH
mgnify:CR=1 FL=1